VETPETKYAKTVDGVHIAYHLVRRPVVVALFSLALATPACVSGSAHPPTSPSVSPSVAFGLSTSYPTGPNVQQIAVADLNGDGTPDLAAAIYDSGTILQLLGNGDGSFRNAGSKFDIAAGIPHPLAIAAADLNGDGHQDLVAVDAGRSKVSVLTNNGDGTFEQSTFAGGSAPQAVITADLSGDGNEDVVTANGGGGVTVLLGLGDGTLGLPAAFSTKSTMCSGLAAADLNGDGALDLVTADSLLGHGASEHTVSVLLGRGDGTFLPATLYPNIGTQPTMVAVADLNGDGSLDLVTPDGAPSSDVTVLFGRGDGTFRSPAFVGMGASPHDAELADLNGDGVPDLVTSDLGTSFDISHPENQGLTVRLGVGDGTFGPKAEVENDWPTSLTTADLNGDGKIDLVVPNELSGEVVVLLNTTHG
jgi:FG-GAP-like repeat